MECLRALGLIILAILRPNSHRLQDFNVNCGKKHDTHIIFAVSRFVLREPKTSVTANRLCNVCLREKCLYKVGSYRVCSVSNQINNTHGVLMSHPDMPPARKAGLPGKFVDGGHVG